MCVCVRHYRNSAGQSLQCIPFWGCIIHVTMLIVVLLLVVLLVGSFCVCRSTRLISVPREGRDKSERKRGGRFEGTYVSPKLHMYVYEYAYVCFAFAFY